jgi:hypothetical protein
MTKAKRRKKSEARISNCAWTMGWPFGYPGLVILWDFVIRHSDFPSVLSAEDD